jgi:hypothetical protein
MLVYVKEPAPDRETRLSELLPPFVTTIGLRTRAHTLLDLHLCEILTLANVWDIGPPSGFRFHEPHSAFAYSSTGDQPLIRPVS